MKKIIIAGGSGLVGGRLVNLLTGKGYFVTVLTRSKRKSDSAGVQFSEWSPAENIINPEVIAEADAIINLSGENVAEKRWSKKRKEQILTSRVQSNQLLINTLKQTNHNCKCFISASAIGWYGPDNTESRQKGFTETAPAYQDFLGNTCKLWEASALEAESLGVRTVILRTGIVLTKEGGALKEFLKPLKSGVAAIIGSGNQTVSWIHIDDVCRMYSYALEHETIKGVYNAVAPHPVTNEQLTLLSATQKRKKMFIPIHVPAFVIRIVLGEMSIEVLKSTTVSASKIKNAGFQFLFPGIQSALSDLIKD